MTGSRPAWSVGPVVAAVVVVAALAAANVARSTIVPRGAHFAFNVALATVVVALGVLLDGLRGDALGLSRRSLGAGLRYGAAAFGVVVLVAVVAAVVPTGRGALDVDDAHVPGGTLAWRIAVVIPLGTVLVEELAFRGVLHGLLNRICSPARTWVLGAVLFGLWHVFPAWHADGMATAAGTFVATTIAGAVFVWLRVRSDSLVAPALAHLATNTVPLTAAWIVAR